MIEKREMPEELRVALRNRMEKKISQFDLDCVCSFWSFENSKFNFSYPPSKPLKLREYERKGVENLSKNDSRIYKELKCNFEVATQKNVSLNKSDYMWIFKSKIVFEILDIAELVEKAQNLLKSYQEYFKRFDSDAMEYVEHMEKCVKRENSYLLDLSEMKQATK